MKFMVYKIKLCTCIKNVVGVFIFKKKCIDSVCKYCKFWKLKSCFGQVQWYRTIQWNRLLHFLRTHNLFGHCGWIFILLKDSFQSLCHHKNMLLELIYYPKHFNYLILTDKIILDSFELGDDYGFFAK